MIPPKETTEKIDYYQHVVDAMNNGKKVFWHYNILGCAEMLKILPDGKLLFCDILGIENEISKEEFNEYNKGIELKYIIDVEQPQPEE